MHVDMERCLGIHSTAEDDDHRCSCVVSEFNPRGTLRSHLGADSTIFLRTTTPTTAFAAFVAGSCLGSKSYLSLKFGIFSFSDKKKERKKVELCHRKQDGCG